MIEAWAVCLIRGNHHCESCTESFAYLERGVRRKVGSFPVYSYHYVHQRCVEAYVRSQRIDADNLLVERLTRHVE